jgi:hypothetical protein
VPCPVPLWLWWDGARDGVGDGAGFEGAGVYSGCTEGVCTCGTAGEAVLAGGDAGVLDGGDAGVLDGADAGLLDGADAGLLDGVEAWVDEVAAAGAAGGLL